MIAMTTSHASLVVELESKFDRQKSTVHTLMMHGDAWRRSRRLNVNEGGWESEPCCPRLQGGKLLHRGTRGAGCFKYLSLTSPISIRLRMATGPGLKIKPCLHVEVRLKESTATFVRTDIVREEVSDWLSSNFISLKIGQQIEDYGIVS